MPLDQFLEMFMIPPNFGVSSIIPFGSHLLWQVYCGGYPVGPPGLIFHNFVIDTEINQSNYFDKEKFCKTFMKYNTGAREK